MTLHLTIFCNYKLNKTTTLSHAQLHTTSYTWQQLSTVHANFCLNFFVANLKNCSIRASPRQNTIQKLSFGNKLKKRCSNGCPGLFPIFSHAQFPRHFKPNLHQSLALPKPKIGQGNAYSCQNHGSHGVALATRRFPCFGLRRLSQLASLGG